MIAISKLAGMYANYLCCAFVVAFVQNPSVQPRCSIDQCTSASRPPRFCLSGVYSLSGVDDSVASLSSCLSAGGGCVTRSMEIDDSPDVLVDFDEG